jgi:hypothetical protein
MTAALVDQAEQGQQARPGAVTPVHEVVVPGGVLPELGEQAAQPVVLLVDRVLGHQVPVLGVEDEDQAHQRGDEAAVEVLRALSGQGLQPALGIAPVGRNEASQQLVERAQHLPGELGRDSVCASRLASRRAGRRSRAGARNRRNSPSSRSRAARIGRPMTVAMWATGKVTWPEVSPLGA